MGAIFRFLTLAAVAALLVVVSCPGCVAVLSTKYYDKTCPNVQRVVRTVMANTVAGDPTVAPAILRLFFHDCFVNVRLFFRLLHSSCSPANL